MDCTSSIALEIDSGRNMYQDAACAYQVEVLADPCCSIIYASRNEFSRKSVCRSFNSNWIDIKTGKFYTWIDLVDRSKVCANVTTDLCYAFWFV